MPAAPKNPRRGRSTWCPALALLGIALLALPAAAGATVEGGATLKLTPGGKGLRAGGVSLRPTGEARLRGRQLSLPAASLRAPDPRIPTVRVRQLHAKVPLRGGVVLRAGRRSLRLRQFEVRVRGRQALVSAKLGKQRLLVFRATGKRAPTLVAEPRGLRLGGAALRLTGGAALALRERLGVSLLRAGAAGSLRLDAHQRAAAAPAQPASEPISDEVPLLARPATAVDVHDVQVTWHPRDSWIRYASSGTGPNDGIFTSAGATPELATASPCPDRPDKGSALLPYSFNFTPAPSWYDPVSGTAGVYGSGAVSFRWLWKGIDLNATNPEIELNGAASRAIFRFNGSGATAYPNQRADLLTLDLAGQPTVSNGGKTFTYNLVRGRLTPNGVKVFANFYTPPDNDEFGCVTVRFTTP